MLRFAWLSELLDNTREVVVRHSQHNSNQWMLPIGAFPNSAAVMLPGKQTTSVGTSLTVVRYYQVDVDASWPLRERYQFLWDIGKWKAQRVVWRSPLSQHRLFDATAPERHNHAIRAFEVDYEEDLLVSFAWRAFFDHEHPFWPDSRSGWTPVPPPRPC